MIPGVVSEEHEEFLRGTDREAEAPSHKAPEIPDRNQTRVVPRASASLSRERCIKGFC